MNRSKEVFGESECGVVIIEKEKEKNMRFLNQDVDQTPGP
jgi:hypothetical protein